MHDMKVADVANDLPHAPSQVIHITIVGGTVASIALASLAQGCRL